MIAGALKGAFAENETMACLFCEQPDGRGDSPANRYGRKFGRKKD
jgi:hypothetical protein